MVRTFFAATVLVGLIAAAPVLAAQAKSPRSASAKPDVVGTVNINTASATELERLPGIGPKTAGRIIEYRQKNGAFKKVEELMNVRGVGEKNFLKLRTQITAGVAKPEHAGTQP
jgi:competence protein ComEA